MAEIDAAVGQQCIFKSSLIDILVQGPFINYVDKILRIFDLPPPFVDQFTTYISLCSTIDIWQSPSPLLVYIRSLEQSLKRSLLEQQLFKSCINYLRGQKGISICEGVVHPNRANIHSNSIVRSADRVPAIKITLQSISSQKGLA